MMNVFAILLLSFASQGQMKFKADIFNLGSNWSGDQISTLEVEHRLEGEQLKTLATYRGHGGEEQFIDEGILTAADKSIVEFRIQQKQTGESGKVKVEGRKVFFEYTDAKGKTKKAEETLQQPLVASINILYFIRNNWNRLMAGESVPVRFAVWDRRETVGFEFTKMGTKSHGGQELVEIRMKPSSFIIAALVDPIYMWFTADGSKIQLLKGRVPLKKRDGGKWTPLDAESRYTWL
ncbi:MAG: hypothetical protein N2578_04235 [Bdellovibrionaceae bacterium]|nr:hypothetical protein [Pseudobdellovibrionaceae bacterium]